jgi:hypothetical protein
MAFSALVDADWLDTEAFMSPAQAAARQHQPQPPLAALRDCLDTYLARFGQPHTPVHRARAEVLAACRSAAVHPPGLFSLTVPTGGGKTLSSLAFALDHAVRHGLERVIYVLPFTSIIEQNAAVFREVFALLGRDVVVEHHSNLLVAQQRNAFPFGDRNRRPPLDPLNALLSYLYTLLRFDAAGALAAHGLDPAVGFLHRDRPGRESLALDLQEEFRAPYADRLALSLVNRQQIRLDHFRTLETGAILLTDDGRKEVLVAWQKRKQDEIEHPFLGEKISIGLLLHAQALLLARHLRGDLDAYPPFEWR